MIIVLFLFGFKVFLHIRLNYSILECISSLFALTSNPYDFLNLFSQHLTFEHKQQN
jgi:hypothetical protein